MSFIAYAIAAMKLIYIAILFVVTINIKSFDDQVSV